MSPTSGHRTSWLIAPITALAVVASLGGISSLLESGTWPRTLTALLAGATVSVMVGRRLTTSRLLPTAVTALLAVLTTTVLFARDDAGERFHAPTPAAVSAWGRALREGADQVIMGVAPTPVTESLLALLAVLALAVFLCAEALAASWRAGGYAGLVLLIPWVPGMVLPVHTSLPALAAAAVCWLLILGLTAAREVTAPTASLPLLTMSAVAVVAVAAVTAPLALGAPGWGAFPHTTASHTPPTRLALDLDLQDSLTVRSRDEVLQYTSDGGPPEAWRMATLVDFDGRSWAYTPPTATQLSPSIHAWWPEPLSPWDANDAALLRVSVTHLSQTLLPLPTAPRIVAAPGTWQYAPASDEAFSSRGTQGLTYDVYTRLHYVDATTLAAMTNLPARDDTRGIGPQYTQLPEGVDVDRLTTLAASLTADSTTRYEKALAIQTYLRDPLAFQYDTSVAPTSEDMVSAFLDQRRGYCVHYATTMVMLLRAADIPSRLAVGFLPGDHDGDGGYVVHGDDAHTWPEVFFPTVGWVRFEPTPASQTGALPEYADPRTGTVPLPPSIADAAQRQEDGLPRATVTPTPDAPAPTAPTPAPVTPAPDATGSSLPAALAWILGGAALLAAVLAAAAVARSRWRRTHPRHHSPERAWAYLRAHLDARWQWPLTLTPLEVPQWLTDAWQAQGFTVDQTTREHLTALAQAVSDARYTPPGDED